MGYLVGGTVARGEAVDTWSKLGSCFSACELIACCSLGVGIYLYVCMYVCICVCVCVCVGVKVGR